MVTNDKNFKRYEISKEDCTYTWEWTDNLDELKKTYSDPDFVFTECHPEPVTEVQKEIIAGLLQLLKDGKFEDIAIDPCEDMDYEGLISFKNFNNADEAAAYLNTIFSRTIIFKRNGKKYYCQHVYLSIASSMRVNQSSLTFTVEPFEVAGGYFIKQDPMRVKF